jgi:hypothetical protein
MDIKEVWQEWTSSACGLDAEYNVGSFCKRSRVKVKLRGIE